MSFTIKRITWSSHHLVTYNKITGTPENYFFPDLVRSGRGYTVTIHFIFSILKDLEEEVGRILSSHNKQWVADQVAYHYGKGEFVVKPKPSFGKAYPLWVFQGTAIRKDSDEAKAQITAGYGKYDTHIYCMT